MFFTPKSSDLNRRSDDEIARRLVVGRAAQATELHRALRDPLVWGEQSLYVLVALTKGLSLSCLLVIALNHSVNGLGAIEPRVLAGAVWPIVAIMVICNPRRLFWRSAFHDRAFDAFRKALRELDGK